MAIFPSKWPFPVMTQQRGTASERCIFGTASDLARNPLSLHHGNDDDSVYIYMGVSWNRGTPKSSILMGCSLINHPFGGTPIDGNPHIHSNWCLFNKNRKLRLLGFTWLTWFPFTPWGSMGSRWCTKATFLGLKLRSWCGGWNFLVNEILLLW